MKISYFIAGALLPVFIACKQEPVAVHAITGKQLNINDSITADTAITGFVAPYKAHLDKTLDSPLAYAPEAFPLSYAKGRLNIAIGNLMADIVYAQANPVFKTRSGKAIDFVLLNYGGIRAPISEGIVTERTAYEVMPFENSIVVAEITAEKMDALLAYLAAQRRPHPLSSQISITLDNVYKLKSVTLNGKPLERNRNYYVATSDYLVNLGDNMNFFSDPVSVTEIGYTIRNAITDYFKKTDTLVPVTDNRFIKTN